eukprot:3840564-Pyramimonas_sp.AAC.1
MPMSSTREALRFAILDRAGCWSFCEDRRGGAPGGHHHRPASASKSLSSRRAFGELAPPRARSPLAHRCRRASRALPRTLARASARVNAYAKLFRTRCRDGRVAARTVDRRRWAAGGHHHRPASSLKPFSSQRALREKIVTLSLLVGSGN